MASISVQRRQFNRRGPKLGQGQSGEVERADLGGLSLLIDRSPAKLPKGFSGREVIWRRPHRADTFKNTITNSSLTLQQVVGGAGVHNMH